jgi:hypothetical protein
MEPWVLTGYANVKIMDKKYSYTDKYNGSVVRLSIAKEPEVLHLGQNLSVIFLIRHNLVISTHCVKNGVIVRK